LMKLPVETISKKVLASSISIRRSLFEGKVARHDILPSSSIERPGAVARAPTVEFTHKLRR
jgi:hypothetical protein